MRMHERVARELTRWESGDISFEELESLHPGTGQLVRVHAALARAGDAAAPDPERAWAALSERLPARPVSLAERARRRMRRPVLLGVAAALVAAASIAYAAAPETVRGVVGGFARIFVGGEPKPQVTPRPIPSATAEDRQQSRDPSEDVREGEDRENRSRDDRDGDRSEENEGGEGNEQTTEPGDDGDRQGDNREPSGAPEPSNDLEDRSNPGGDEPDADSSQEPDEHPDGGGEDE